jgi:hypothetical protein
MHFHLGSLRESLSRPTKPLPISFDSIKQRFDET